jgi:hypothetical protein
LLTAIPKEAHFFRNLLIREFHLAHHHSSTESTLSYINQRFFCPKLRQQIKNFTKMCFTCQLSKARCSWDSPPVISNFDLEETLKLPPYSRLFLDFVNLGGAKAASCTFFATKHTTWLVASSENSHGALRVLEELQSLRGKFDVVVCDRATYFNNLSFNTQVVEKFNAKVEYMAHKSPFQGFEVIHSIGLRVIRQILRSKRIRVENLNTEELRILLNQMCLVVNRRPLFSCFEDHLNENSIAPLTPNLLAFGSNYRVPLPWSESPDVEVEKIETRLGLRKARLSYLNQWWLELKKKSLQSIQSRCCPGRSGSDILVGEVVIKYVASNKTKLDFEFSRVIGRRSKNSYWLLRKDSRVSSESAYNLQKILRPPIEGSGTKIGPSRFGQCIRVRFRWLDAQNKAISDSWYRGLLSRYCEKSGSHWVHWTNGDPASLINLSEVDYFILEGGHVEDESSNFEDELNTKIKANSIFYKEDIITIEPSANSVVQRNHKLATTGQMNDIIWQRLGVHETDIVRNTE